MRAAQSCGCSSSTAGVCGGSLAPRVYSSAGPSLVAPAFAARAAFSMAGGCARLSHLQAPRFTSPTRHQLHLPAAAQGKGGAGGGSGSGATNLSMDDPMVQAALNSVLGPWAGPVAQLATSIGIPTYLGRAAGEAASSGREDAASVREDLSSPVFVLIAINLAVYFLTVVVPVFPLTALQLQHKAGATAVAQLITSPFVHTSVVSLTQCMFFTYTFGRIIETNFGRVAVWAVYLASALGAAALACFMLPARSGLVSTTAPAAVFGLFVAAIALPRALRKPWEVACLAPFACAATVARYTYLGPALVASGTPIGQLLHVTGAFVAAAAVYGVLYGLQQVQAAIEAKREAERRKREREEADRAVKDVLNFATKAAQEVLGAATSKKGGNKDGSKDKDKDGKGRK